MANSYTHASFGIEVPSKCEDKVHVVIRLIDIVHDCWDYEEVAKVRELTALYKKKEFITNKRDMQEAIKEAVSSCVMILHREGFTNPQDSRFNYALNILPSLVREIAGWTNEMLEHQGFDWSYDPKEDDEIWIRNDETIDIDSAIAHVQLVARLVPEMQVTAPWYATWANTCSAQRIDEFGGGAAVFNATRATFLDAHTWKTKEMKKYLAQIEKKKQHRKR